MAITAHGSGVSAECLYVCKYGNNVSMDGVLQRGIFTTLRPNRVTIGNLIVELDKG